MNSIYTYNPAGEKNATTKRYGTMLRIYDNGGRTTDRYTIVPSKFDRKYLTGKGYFMCIGSSEYPYYAQGFGMWVECMPGAHLGKRLHIGKLPHDVLKFTKESFPEYFEKGEYVNGEWVKQNENA